MDLISFLRSPLERELDENRNELNNILKDEEPGQHIDELRKFALKIGTSTIKQIPGYGLADEPELLHNIHIALQTKAMIATVKTTSNYVIVSVVLSFIALGSMIASFIMAFR
jgi:hypothetical protein